MKNVYKVINNVHTNLITWGNPFDCKGQDVIVCITGNPGVADFYIEFGSDLHEQTSLPVCVIGQAGHDKAPDQDLNKLKGQEELSNLQGQVEHKFDLIKNHIDKKSQIHIIGHSIGAWMVIELMNKNDFLQEKILTTHLLFPTIQKMRESKNGLFLNNIVRRMHFIIMFLVYLLQLIPDILFKFLVNCYIKFHSFPSNYFLRLRKFLNPEVVEKVLFMAYDEMDTVVTLNTKGINKLCIHTHVIYSKRDNWAPVHYIEDLKTVKPSIELKQVDITHAFVLKSSKRVADMVSEYIKPRVTTAIG